MRDLDRRLRRLETVRAPFVLADAIDRPPQETREQWLARVSAEARNKLYDSGERNSRGESRQQWLMRRRAELGMESM